MIAAARCPAAAPLFRSPMRQAQTPASVRKYAVPSTRATALTGYIQASPTAYAERYRLAGGAVHYEPALCIPLKRRARQGPEAQRTPVSGPVSDAIPSHAEGFAR